MELSEEEIEIQQDALDYIKSHKDELINEFIISKRPIRLSLLTFFMAGSPGAGKTEFSKRYMTGEIDKNDLKLVNSLKERGFDVNDFDTLFIRIDVDSIRDFLPQYRKTDKIACVNGNAHVVQKAANKGLDILRNYCFKNDISFLHDGTFGNYDTMRELVKKSIKLKRVVRIFYIYLDPLIAWEFTKAREAIEGRNIIREKFVEQFFSSRENVDKIKKEFGDKIILDCIIKDQDNKVEEIQFNIENVDIFIKKYYNRKSINNYTKSNLLKSISNV